MASRAAREPAFEDLTARARIREAAIQLFTDRGVQRTAILDIATAAGVSGGLIRHHFGSKDGLRVACDTFVFDELERLKAQALDEGLTDPALFPTFDARQVLLRRYVGRAMIDGSPAASARFVDLVDQTETWFAGQPELDLPDARASAALLAAMSIGALAMQDHVATALGEDPLSTQLLVRLALASADLYSHPLISPEIAERVHAALKGTNDHD